MVQICSQSDYFDKAFIATKTSNLQDLDSKICPRL